MAISLQDWASGDSNYVATYNSNNSIIETAVGTLQAGITGSAALNASISPMLRALFGTATARIGPSSCTASIVSQTVHITAGYVNVGGGQVVEVASTQVVDCSTFGNVTIYLSIDSVGGFTASTSSGGNDLYSVAKSGTTLSSLTKIATTVGIPFEWHQYKQGAPTSSEVVARIVTPRPVVFKSGLSGSYAKAGTAATGSTTFNITHNGSNVGSLNFAVSATSATFTFTADLVTAAGDTLTVVGPGSADATLANIAFALLGYQAP